LVCPPLFVETNSAFEVSPCFFLSGFPASAMPVCRGSLLPVVEECCFFFLWIDLFTDLLPPYILFFTALSWFLASVSLVVVFLCSFFRQVLFFFLCLIATVGFPSFTPPALFFPFHPVILFSRLSKSFASSSGWVGDETPVPFFSVSFDPQGILRK